MSTSPHPQPPRSLPHSESEADITYVLQWYIVERCARARLPATLACFRIRFATSSFALHPTAPSPPTAAATVPYELQIAHLSSPKPALLWLEWPLPAFCQVNLTADCQDINTRGSVKVPCLYKCAGAAVGGAVGASNFKRTTASTPYESHACTACAFQLLAYDEGAAEEKCARPENTVSVPLLILFLLLLLLSFIALFLLVFLFIPRLLAYAPQAHSGARYCQTVVAHASPHGVRCA
ncbi:unnamed protein product [Schistocephalus solidus]|uniref:Uncharacterized protein n=1 Tax=Schistocephalus solidus TaxID=70667 RepID=A0A183STC6_SCHSO|nr:unnamed protein product [Schistocephalus solidus]